LIAGEKTDWGWTYFVNLADGAQVGSRERHCLLSFYFHPVVLCTSISNSDFSPRMFKILVRTSSYVSLNFPFLKKFRNVTGYLNEFWFFNHLTEYIVSRD
jgi:hypothetical protein